MQTFLPYASFSESARVLDRQRLGKQRVETLQIMQVLTHSRITNATRQVFTDVYKPVPTDDDGTYELKPIFRTEQTPAAEWNIDREYYPNGWKNHPMIRMWRGYEHALVTYQRAICFEWTNNRGYKDTCLDKTIALAGDIGGDDVVLPGGPYAPPWLGDDALHLSHRSNLLRKNSGHYRPFWPLDPNDLPYVWPAG